MTKDDRKKLRAELLATAEASKKFGYNPSRFVQDLNASEPDDLVTRYVLTDKPTDGFTRLWQEQRLDLAVENVAWKFRHLFPAEVVEKARRRLREGRFNVETQKME